MASTRAHRLGAVGQRRDGVRSADSPDLVDAESRQRVAQDRLLEVGPRRRRDGDPGDARDLGRHDRHERGRRVARPPSGHVEADPGERLHDLRERHSGALDDEAVSRGRELRAMETARRCAIASSTASCTSGVTLRQPPSSGSGASRRSAIAPAPREAVVGARRLEQRRVATLANGGDDPAHRLLHLGIEHRRRGAARCAGAGAGPAAPRRARCAERSHAATPARSRRPRRAASSERRICQAARWTTKQGAISRTRSISSRPCARRVEPVCTMSRMKSASPTSGASSIEPESSRISALQDWRSRKRSAVRGILGGEPHLLAGARQGPARRGR